MGLTTIWTLQKKKISDIEKRAIETTHVSHGGGKKTKKDEQKISELRNNIKWSNIHVVRVLKGEEKEKSWKKNHFNFSPKFNEKYPPTDPRNSMNSKQNKHEIIHKHIVNW